MKASFHWKKDWLWPTLREQKACLLRIVISLVFLSAAQSAFLLLIGPLFKALFTPTSKSNLSFFQLLPKQSLSYFPNQWDFALARSELAFAIPAAILLVSLIKAVASFVYQSEQQILTLHLGRRYREFLFSRLVKLPFLRIMQKAPGEWMSIVMNDVSYLQMRLSDLLTSLVRDGAMVLASLLSLFFIHLPTAILILFVSYPIMRKTGKTGKKISGFAERWQKDLGSMVQAALDLRKRFDFIRAQQGESFEEKQFFKKNNNYYRMIRGSIWMRSALAPTVEFLGFALFALVIAAIAHRIAGFRLEASELLQFFAALGILIRPLKNIGEQLSRYHETRGVLQQSLRTLEEVQTQQDQGAPVAVAPATSNLPQGDEEWRWHRLAVSPGSGFEVRGEQLSLKQGQSIALIGPSGAGKSTLIKTLAGLFPYKEWSASQSWDACARQATLVSQTPFLFSASIRDNLCYGLDHEVDEARLWAELEFVGLKQEFEAMGQSLDSPIHFLQTPLSGGQMQRLTIARALLRQTQILLFDEVTSAIDPLAEEELTRKLIRRCQEESRFLFFITHRMSQLEYFDQVWFIEKGVVQAFPSPKLWQNDERIQAFIQGVQASFAGSAK